MMPTVLRRAARASAIAVGPALVLLAAPAEAKPPSTWQEADEGSLLSNLLLLVGVPVLVFLVLALLVYLPSMIRNRSGESSVAFQERSEWFGGPRKGVDAAPEGAGDDAAAKGGASASW